MMVTGVGENLMKLEIKSFSSIGSDQYGIQAEERMVFHEKIDIC